MDESTKIHPDAKPTHEKGTDVQIGWAYTYDGYFDYVAEWTEDCVSIYVEWGDDRIGDMYLFETWAEVRRDLQDTIALVQMTNKLDKHTSE
jgi:hypothetical protein